MKDGRNELMIPPAALADPRAFEILRVWAAANEQHVVIHSGLHGGAAGFGFMLAQLLEHGARLYSEREHADIAGVRALILQSLHEELEERTGNAIGGVTQ